MIKIKSLKLNFLYNAIYQVLILIIPLITIPYVSRVIGSNGVGTYSYTYSIIYYFMIFSMLGINNYGNRQIAKVRENKEVLSKTFKEIYVLQIIMTLFMLFVYGIFLVIFKGEMLNIFLAQSLYLISCMFDINWLFFGMEEFKLSIFRNTLVKILELIFIFLFVKSSSDTLIYTLILSGGTLISQLIIWPFLKKFVNLDVKIDIHDIKKHFLPCLKLFFPVIAVTIYRFMDKIMLGILANVNEVGYYENAEKIINAPISIIYALGTIMLPRMSNMFANKKEAEIEKLINKSIVFAMFMAFPMAFGISAIANKFSVIYFGNEFSKSGNVMIFLSPTISFIGWGNVIRTQYLIPNEMDNIYINSTFIGAIINVILNSIFIPIYGATGACIGTVISEFVVMFYQTYKVKNELNINKYIKEIIPFFIKSIIMFGIIKSIDLLNIKDIYIVLIQLILGVTIYAFLNFKYIKGFLPVKLKKERK